MTCTSCNQALPEGARFCGNCGQSVDTTAEVAATPAETVIPNQAEAGQAAAPSATTAPVTEPAAEAAQATATVLPTATAGAEPPAPPTIKLPAEPPAGIALSSSGPILEPASNSHLPLIIGGICFLAIIGAAVWLGMSFVKAAKHGQPPTFGGNGGQPQASTNVNSQCFSFSLPQKVTSVNAGTACGVDVYDKQQDIHMDIQLLDPSVSQASLQQYADTNFQASSHQDGISGKAVSFAGQPAYQYDYQYNSTTKGAYLYVYDKDSTVTGGKTNYHGYVISLQAKQDLQALVDSASQSWRWAGRGRPLALTGSLPLATAATDCFSFTTPAGASLTGSPADCSLYADYNQPSFSRLRVWTSLEPQGDLKSEVASWKKQQHGAHFSSETATKVGGLDAAKLVYRLPTDRTDHVGYLVFTGPKYRIGGTYADSFEIDAYYGTPAEIKTTDDMIASWKWL